MKIAKKKSFFLKLGLFMILMFFSFTTAFSSAGALTVVLANQNPDPVAPGNFVYLNVKVSNSGSEPIQNAVINFENNEIFSIAKGSDSQKELGVIPAYSSISTANNFVIAKFKVKVNDNAPLGLNTVKFLVTTNSQVYKYNFEVLVQDKNPRLEVTHFNINTLKAGSSGTLVMQIENRNSISLQNVLVSLGLSKVTNGALSMKSGSNQLLISSLKPQEKRNVTFDIVASPDASSMPYNLPVDISYQDSLGNTYNTSVLGSVSVYSEPILSVKLDSQDIYSSGKGKLSIAVANPGVSTIKGTQIEILPSDNYQILGGGSQYIGDLNPDDFQTAQTQLYINANKSFDLKVRTTYLDSYNKQIVKIMDVPVKIYSTNELQSFGLSTANGTSNYVMYVVVLVLLIISFVIGRKIGFKKGKAKRNT